MVEMISVSSSNIESIGYDSDNRILHVNFIHTGTYVYYEVDESVFQEFLAAGSKGTYLNTNIKGYYNYEKI